MACNHDCKSCGENCGKNTNLMFEPNELNQIGKIIGVVSGKGGVGKSLVTSMLAVNLANAGFKVGILDADITGPSIPKAFGLKNGIEGADNLMFPALTKKGIKVMSINLLMDNPEAPVLWRGPVVGGALKQFYSETLWQDLDFLLIDMPPGTSDVAITVFQSIPVDGLILVSTPQDLVKMIVGKAVNMANQMKIKIVGLVENMAYMECPCCGNPLYPFGPSKLIEVADHYNIKPIASLPIKSDIAKYVDEGNIEDVDVKSFDVIRKAVEEF